MLKNKLKRDKLKILKRIIFLKREKLKNNILKHQINNQMRINIGQLINNKNNEEVIPRNIFQAWHSDNLLNSVKFCIENVKSSNPNFNYYYIMIINVENL
jgi:mannosyltransferase OCH1-like enzyme